MNIYIGLHIYIYIYRLYIYIAYWSLGEDHDVHNCTISDLEFSDWQEDKKDIFE